MPMVRNESVGFDGNQYLPLAGGTMSGNIAVGTDNAIDLGTSLKAWRTINAYTLTSRGVLALDAVTGITVGGASATSVQLGRAGQTLQANTHLLPSGDNTLDLGLLTGATFRNLNAYNMDSKGALAIGPTSATSLALGNAGIIATVLGKLRYDNTSGSASTGGGSLPALVRGYLVVSVAGVDKKVPYYDN